MEGKKIIDVHCHVLPGIDDGSESMDESIRMLYIAQKEGITDVIATPHFKGGRRNAGPQTVERLLQRLRERALETNLHVNVHLGNEVLYFSEMEDDLLEKRIFPMNLSRFVLVEFMPGDGYDYIRNALDHVRGMGYTPVIAHVERYVCMWKNKDAVRGLRDRGARIQVNAGSVTGEVGWRVKRFTHELLSGRLVDYIGTDAHGCVRRTPGMKKCAHLLHRKYGSEYADRVLFFNAWRDFWEQSDG